MSDRKWWAQSHGGVLVHCIKASPGQRQASGWGSWRGVAHVSDVAWDFMARSFLFWEEEEAGYAAGQIQTPLRDAAQ